MSFRLFGFDVEVRLSFLIGAVLLSAGGTLLNGQIDSETIRGILVWIPCLFVSILIHELGHAFAIRWQKLPAEIQLHWMGGTTTWRELLPISRGARIVISLAGPFAGFAFGGVVLAVGQVFAIAGHPLVWYPASGSLFYQIVGIPRGVGGVVYTHLVFVNFIWGAVNLLPVLPFDGGHVLQEALGKTRVRISLLVSAVVGSAVCLYFLGVLRNMWGAYLFGSSAMSSIVALRSLVPARRPKATTPRTSAAASATAAALKRAESALADDRPDDALAVVKEIVAERPTQAERAKALTIAVWAELMRGDEAAASEALSGLAELTEPDPALVGNVALATGRLTEARAALERAYQRGDRRKEVFGPLIQALLRLDAHEQAARIALDRIDGLSAEDCRRIAELAAEGGAQRAAAKVLERLAERDHQPDDFLAAIRAWLKAGDRRRASNLTDSPALRGTPAERTLRDDSELASLLETPSP